MLIFEVTKIPFCLSLSKFLLPLSTPNEAVSNSADAQVVRFTCAVALFAFCGSRTTVIATVIDPLAANVQREWGDGVPMKKPKENRK